MEFDEFIKRETAQDDAELERLRAARREEWLGHLDDLYHEVRSILRGYVDAGKVEITESEVERREDLLGAYRARQMEVKLGNRGKFVQLIPVGMGVIGAHGRVDMSGPNGSLRLVLVDAGLRGPRIEAGQSAQPGELVWRFATMPPRIEYIPLDKETFLDAVVKLSDNE